METVPGRQVSSISTSAWNEGDALLGAILGISAIPCMARSQPGIPA
jgi:hypothetical protein